MMATTHGFVGLALAAGVAAVAPELALPAAVGGIVGGIAPDFDVVADHRKTLHFPVYYSIAAVLTGAVALSAPGAATVAVAVGFAAAALHATSDVFGNGPEVRSWAIESSRAVYVHALGRWAKPRRWVRYDGSPEDFLLGVAFAMPGLTFFEPPISTLVIVGLVVSFIYTAFRKPIGRRLAPGGGERQSATAGPRGEQQKANGD